MVLAVEKEIDIERTESLTYAPGLRLHSRGTCSQKRWIGSSRYDWRDRKSGADLLCHFIFCVEPLKFVPMVTDSCALTFASLEETWFYLPELSNNREKTGEPQTE